MFMESNEELEVIKEFLSKAIREGVLDNDESDELLDFAKYLYE